MKQYAVYFSDYGVMEDVDVHMSAHFETLDEACKFALAISKKARYFDINIVDLFEEDEELFEEDEEL